MQVQLDEWKEKFWLTEAWNILIRFPKRNHGNIPCQIATWWLIPLSKWVITPVISGLTLLIPFITGVITHLLSGMSHQVMVMGISCPWLSHHVWGFILKLNSTNCQRHPPWPHLGHWHLSQGDHSGTSQLDHAGFNEPRSTQKHDGD